MAIKKILGHYLRLIFLVTMSYNLQAGNKIAVDIDADNIKDRIYFEYLPNRQAILTFRLSRQNFLKIESQPFALNNYIDSDLSISHANNLVELLLSTHGAERVRSVFAYNPLSKSVELVKLEHSLDGDNDNNGTGSASVDLTTKYFNGAWTTRDITWNNGSGATAHYRTSLPVVRVKVDWPVVSLPDYGEQLISKFRSLRKFYYEQEFYRKFPSGNSMHHSVLERDFNGDLSADSIAYDFYTGKIIYTDSVINESIASLPIEIDSQLLYIKEAKTGFYLVSRLVEAADNKNIDLQYASHDFSFQFKYDAWARSFRLIGFSQNTRAEGRKIHSSHNVLTGENIIEVFTAANQQLRSIKYKQKISSEAIYLAAFDGSFYKKYMSQINHKISAL